MIVGTNSNDQTYPSFHNQNYLKDFSISKTVEDHTIDQTLKLANPNSNCNNRLLSVKSLNQHDSLQIKTFSKNTQEFDKPSQEDKIDDKAVNSKFCRICLEEGDYLIDDIKTKKRVISNYKDDKDFLINPCDCKGTSSFIHSVCIKKWISEIYSGNYLAAKCELCLKPFQLHEKLMQKDLSKESKCKVAKMIFSGIVGILVLDLLFGFLIANFSKENYSIYILLSVNAIIISLFVCYMIRFVTSLKKEAVVEITVIDKRDPRYNHSV